MFLFIELTPNDDVKRFLFSTNATMWENYTVKLDTFLRDLNDHCRYRTLGDTGVGSYTHINMAIHARYTCTVIHPQTRKSF